MVPFSYIILFLYGPSLISGSVLRNDDLYRLDIIHYNDFHDRFEETSVKFPICQTNDTRCLGGFARLYQEIKSLLNEKPDALLFNAGDVFQGTYWYNLLKWNVTQHFINMLPNDAHALGNHEFDDAVESLAPYLAGLRAPVLAANMEVGDESPLKGLFKPHVVIKKRGRKIGIIGLITTETAVTSKSNGVKFLDPIPIVQREAQLLTDQGVDIIIVLSHCGLGVDKQIAKTVGENIDIIVGGHSHSLLWNGNPPSQEPTSGNYPIIEESHETGHKVLVVTASSYTKYLGNLTTYFDQSGEIQSYAGEPVFLNRSIPEDPEIKRLLEPYNVRLHELVHEVVGHSDKSLPDGPCSSQECVLGNLLADAYLNATKEAISSNYTHVGFFIRNMMRGAFPKGDITRGSILAVSPFSNIVTTFVLSGRYLLQALDHCMTTHYTENPFTGAWIPQIAGLQVTLDGNLQRAVSVLVKEGEEFVPLRLNQEYQVTTVDFLSTGKNGFTMLSKYGRDFKTIVVDAEAQVNYFKKISTFTPTIDGRLTIVNY